MPMTMRIGNENHPRAFALSDDSFFSGGGDAGAAR